MLITINLDAKCITKQSISQLTENLATQLLSTLSLTPCQTYAVCTAISSAADKVLERVKSEATETAELIHEGTGCTGADVVVEGLPFQVKHTKVFDFGKKAAWKSAKRVLIQQEAQIKHAKVALKAIEDQLALSMQPVSITTSIAFTPKDA